MARPSNLEIAIAKVAPVHKVTIGNVSDKSTWVIDFKAAATTQQRAAAQAIITAWQAGDWGKARDWASVRAKVKRLLVESDWTQLNDAPLTTQQIKDWKDYRVALRGILTAASPETVVWPKAPTGGAK